MKSHALDSFFKPKSVALAGSIKPGKINYEIIKSMNEGEYQGRIFPINPANGEVLGHKVYSSISDLPEDVAAGNHALLARGATSFDLSEPESVLRAITASESGQLSFGVSPEM